MSLRAKSIICALWNIVTMPVQVVISFCIYVCDPGMQFKGFCYGLKCAIGFFWAMLVGEKTYDDFIEYVLMR